MAVTNLIPISENISKTASQFISLCVQHEPEFRAPASGLLRHPFLKICRFLLSSFFFFFSFNFPSFLLASSTMGADVILNKMFTTTEPQSESSSFVLIGNDLFDVDKSEPARVPFRPSLPWTHLNFEKNPSAPFRGRTEEIRLFNDYIKNPSVSFVAITGRAGIGKSFFMAKVLFFPLLFLMVSSPELQLNTLSLFSQIIGLRRPQGGSRLNSRCRFHQLPCWPRGPGHHFPAVQVPGSRWTKGLHW